MQYEEWIFWNLFNCTKWASRLKVGFYQRYWSKLFLTSAFICQQLGSIFQRGKNAMNTYIIPLLMLLYYRKHPVNDNKIFPLPASASFQQHFHNLNKCHYYLISNKSEICWTNVNCSPFQSLSMLYITSC